MPAIEVVADANIALKWFHEAGEQEVAAARRLVDEHRGRRVILYVLDLTFYELGNALMRGHIRASPGQTATVLTALREICPIATPDDDDFALAT